MRSWRNIARFTPGSPRGRRPVFARFGSPATSGRPSDSTSSPRSPRTLHRVHHPLRRRRKGRTLPAMWLTVLLPLGWILVLALNRAYDTRYLFIGSEEYQRVFRAGCAFMASVAVVALRAQRPGRPRLHADRAAAGLRDHRRRPGSRSAVACTVRGRTATGSAGWSPSGTPPTSPSCARCCAAPATTVSTSSAPACRTPRRG